MAVVPGAEASGWAAPTVTAVVDGADGAGIGLAAASGPLTPAFWPQAADTSTATTAIRARNRTPAVPMGRQRTTGT
jgi:hypothetical protein